MKKILITIVLSIMQLSTFAQFSFEENTGFSVGLSFSVGTHINRIGITAKAFIFKNFAQLNLGTSYYYNFTGFERVRKYSEFQNYITMLYAYGKTDSIKNMVLSQVSNHTLKKNSIAYSFNIYTNRINSSQRTGIICDTIFL